jgi:hypothetical protein
MRGGFGQATLIGYPIEEAARMHRTHTITTLAVASVLALAAPSASLAHGGGGTLTQAQVIARGTVICKAGERAVYGLPQVRSQHPFSAGAPKGDRSRAIRFLAGYALALDGVRKGLARLQPPPPGKALFEGFVADLGPTVARFRRAHDDALAGRFAAAQADAQSAFAMFARASAKTAAYGFPKGVCQSG